MAGPFSFATDDRAASPTRQIRSTELGRLRKIEGSFPKKLRRSPYCVSFSATLASALEEEQHVYPGKKLSRPDSATADRRKTEEIPAHLRRPGVPGGRVRLGPDPDRRDA